MLKLHYYGDNWFERSMWSIYFSLSIAIHSLLNTAAERNQNGMSNISLDIFTSISNPYIFEHYSIEPISDGTVRSRHKNTNQSVTAPFPYQRC